MGGGGGGGGGDAGGDAGGKYNQTRIDIIYWTTENWPMVVFTYKELS